MRLLLFSDLHGVRHFNELQEFIKLNPYDYALGLGDFGEGWGPCVTLNNLSVIYGNHDDLDAIQSYEGWLKDGLNEVAGLKVCAVNGIWGTKGKLWHRTVTSTINLIKGVGEVDLLVTHEHPYGLPYHTYSGKYKFLEDRPWCKEFAEAVKEYLAPKLWVYGHSYTSLADRRIPELGVRTLGLDGRFVIVDEAFKVLSVNETEHFPF